MHRPSPVSRTRRVRRAARVAAALACAWGCAAAFAHGAQAGAVAIRHPYATPSLPGTVNGAAYLRTVENTGTTADRLVRATTPVAARVELHTMAVDAQGVMRMREVDAIALPPKAALQMRPGAGYHLMLMGLKAPLKEGGSFPMTLQFERGGSVDVKVMVETPPARSGDASASEHKH